MAQYIPKSDVVAELRRLKKNAEALLKYPYNVAFRQQKLAMNDLLSFIDTLEVKEVDFGTEVYKYIEEHFNMYDDGNQTLQTKDKKSLIGMADVENIAKHFFELGLKAQKGE